MKNKKIQECWGLFRRKNPGFTGTNRDPLVICDTKETAEKMMKDVDFIHYNSKYKDFVIKKITKEVDIPEWQR